MSDEVRPLLGRLDLERLDRDLFRGHAPQDGRRRVFGGLVAGQALVAACRTVQDRRAHSLHAYFLRPGDPKTPIIYDVDRIRDGKSFTTRRVVAVQDGEAIFNMSVSFHIDEDDQLSHQVDMPEAPAPESLPSNVERYRGHYEETNTELFRYMAEIERPIRQADADYVSLVAPEARTGLHRVWFRAESELPDDPLLHQCVLTYASDMSLLDNCLHAHGRTWFDKDLVCASLDHAIWFHRPFRADQWLLYAMESPTSSGGRGFNHGHIFAEDGRLVASVVQESLIRVKSRES